MSIFDIFRKKKKLVGKWEKFYNSKDLKYKIPNISMYEQIRNTAFKYPKYIAYRYFNTKVNYEKFLKQIDRVSLSFDKLGVKKGDIVTICLPNVPEAIICVYALNRIGAIANMLHPLSAEEEIKSSLISTNSIYLVCMDMHYEKIKNIIGDTSVRKTIYVSVADSMDIIYKIGYAFSKKVKFEKYVKNSVNMSFRKFYNLSLFSEKKKFRAYGKNTPAVILHSGGTSGKPKNVVL